MGVWEEELQHIEELERELRNEADGYVDYDEFKAILDRGESLTIKQQRDLLEAWHAAVLDFLQEHVDWQKEHDKTLELRVHLRRAKRVIKSVKELSKAYKDPYADSTILVQRIYDIFNELANYEAWERKQRRKGAGR